MGKQNREREKNVEKQKGKDMTWYSSGNHMVPDVEKDPPEEKCPVCGSTDVDDGYKCNDCHFVQPKKEPCGNTNCGGEDLRAVKVCNNCEHTWTE